MAACVAVLHHVADGTAFSMGLVLLFTDGGVIERQRCPARTLQTHCELGWGDDSALFFLAG